MQCGILKSICPIVLLSDITKELTYQIASLWCPQLTATDACTAGEWTVLHCQVQELTACVYEERETAWAGDGSKHPKRHKKDQVRDYHYIHQNGSTAKDSLVKWSQSIDEESEKNCTLEFDVFRQVRTKANKASDKKYTVMMQAKDNKGQKRHLEHEHELMGDIGLEIIEAIDGTCILSAGKFGGRGNLVLASLNHGISIVLPNFELLITWAEETLHSKGLVPKVSKPDIQEKHKEKEKKGAMDGITEYFIRQNAKHMEKFLNVTNLKKLKCFDFALNNIEKIENLEGSEGLKKINLINFTGGLSNSKTLQHSLHLKEFFCMGNPHADFERYWKLCGMIKRVQNESKNGRIYPLIREEKFIVSNGQIQKSGSEETKNSIKIDKKSNPGFDRHWHTDIITTILFSLVNKEHQTLEVIDVNAQSVYVRGILKGKSHQLIFPKELKPHSNSARKSLVICMPKVEKVTRSLKTTLDTGREQTNKRSKQIEKLVVDSNMHVYPDVANVVQEEKHTPQSVGSEPKLY
ncbi:hypothetical protein EI555_014485, partial [Monodon monoceros]